MFALRGLFSAKCNPMRDVAGGKMYLQIYADVLLLLLLSLWSCCCSLRIAEPFIQGSKSRRSSNGQKKKKKKRRKLKAELCATIIISFSSINLQTLLKKLLHTHTSISANYLAIIITLFHFPIPFILLRNKE